MPEELEHPDVFRAPTKREHTIAAWLFIGMAFGFFLLFYVLSGWWFRWVILAIGGYSFLDGVRHWRNAKRTT